MKQKILALYEIENNKKLPKMKKNPLKDFQIKIKEYKKEASLDLKNSNNIKLIDNITPRKQPDQDQFQKNINSHFEKVQTFDFFLKKTFDSKFKIRQQQEKIQNKTQQFQKINQKQNSNSKATFKVHFPPESVLQLQLRESAQKNQANLKNEYQDQSHFCFRQETFSFNQKQFLTKFIPLKYFNETEGDNFDKWTKNKWVKQRYDSQKINQTINQQFNSTVNSRNGVFFQRGFHYDPVIIK